MSDNSQKRTKLTNNSYPHQINGFMGKNDLYTKLSTLSTGIKAKNTITLW